MSYQVYDPVLGSANMVWDCPIVSFSETLLLWNFHYITDLLSFNLMLFLDSFVFQVVSVFILMFLVTLFYHFLILFYLVVL